MTTKTTQVSSATSPKTLLAIGAGVAALATASYYLFGPEGKTHRKTMKGWMIKMKGDIVDRIEDVKELTEPVYHDIVDSVATSYAATAKVGKEELQAFTERLKGQWKEIVASTKNEPRRVARRVASATKKGVSKRVSSSQTY